MLKNIRTYVFRAYSALSSDIVAIYLSFSALFKTFSKTALWVSNFNVFYSQFFAPEYALNSTTSTPSIGRWYSAKRGNVIYRVPGWRGSPFGNNAEISTPVAHKLPPSHPLPYCLVEMQRDLDMGYIERSRLSPPPPPLTSSFLPWHFSYHG